MSADNWTVCPRCCASLSEDERIALMDDDENPLLTFREDYGFYGAHAGAVNVSYSGWCAECGLTCRFEYTEEFYEEGA